MSNALTVAQAKAQPDGMVIPGICGILAEVKPVRTVSVSGTPTRVQDFKIQDGADFLYGSAWDFFELTPSLGTQVIFTSNKAKNNRFSGVTVKDKASKQGQMFKNLSISNVATMHSPATYAASGGTPVQATIPQAAPPPPPQQQPLEPSQQRSVMWNQPTQPPLLAAPQPAPLPEVKKLPVIQGQTVGMAINNAVQIYLAEPDRSGINAEKFLWEVASKVIRVAQRLEQGDLYAYPAPVAEQMVTRVAQEVTRVMKPTPGPDGSAFDTSQGHEDADNLPF